MVLTLWCHHTVWLLINSIILLLSQPCWLVNVISAMSFVNNSWHTECTCKLSVQCIIADAFEDPAYDKKTCHKENKAMVSLAPCLAKCHLRFDSWINPCLKCFTSGVLICKSFLVSYWVPPTSKGLITWNTTFHQWVSLLHLELVLEHVGFLALCPFTKWTLVLSVSGVKVFVMKMTSGLCLKSFSTLVTHRRSHLPVYSLMRFPNLFSV